MVDVAEVLKVLDGKVVPLHEEDAGHEAMGDEDADAGKVVLAKLPPQALVEAANTIVGIGSTLAIGNAVEEVTIVGAFLPHALHLSAAGLKVAKVLLAQAGFFVDLDVCALERGGLVLVRGQGSQDAFGGLACAAVWGGEEVDSVVGTQELAQAAAGIIGLGPAIGGQLDAVVGDRLVDLAVFWGRRMVSMVISKRGSLRLIQEVSSQGAGLGKTYCYPPTERV